MARKHALDGPRLDGGHTLALGALHLAEGDLVRLSLLEHDGVEPGRTGERLVESLVELRKFDGLLPLEEGEARHLHRGVRARRGRCELLHEFGRRRHGRERVEGRSG